MEILRLSPDGGADAVTPALVALGFFDGMHRGHTALLRETVRRAEVGGLVPSVFTFRDTPDFKAGTPRLLSEEARFARLAETGIQRLYLADFDEIRTLPPAKFVSRVLLTACAAGGVVCGYNFHFGAGGIARVDDLAAMLAPHGVPLFVLPPEQEGGEAVSASRVRRALREGRVTEATALLGRPYTLNGEVTHGRALGRRLGHPTANLALPEGRVVPRFGVYAVAVSVDGAPPVGGVANIGRRPTVESDGAPNCEVHLFSEAGDLYGRRLSLSLLAFLREERKFDGTAALREQIGRDTDRAKEIFLKWNGQS